MSNELEQWKLQHVIISALALADSGRYHDFSDIDFALRFEHEWETIRAAIDEPRMRHLLNRRCADARDSALCVAASVVSVALVPESEHLQKDRGLTTDGRALALRHLTGIDGLSGLVRRIGISILATLNIKARRVTC